MLRTQCASLHLAVNPYAVINRIRSSIRSNRPCTRSIKVLAGLGDAPAYNKYRRVHCPLYVLFNLILSKDSLLTLWPLRRIAEADVILNGTIIGTGNAAR